MAGQGDVINIVFSGTFGGSGTPWSMVKDYRITAINTGGVLQSWLNAVVASYSAAWVTQLLADLADDVTLDLATAYNRNSLEEQATTVIDVDGTGTTDGLPLRSAVVIQKNTGQRGRSYRGRMSFPALLASTQDNGIVEAATVGLLTTWAGAIRLLGDSTNNGHLAVYSSTLSTPDIVFSTLVNGFTVRNAMGTIRSRQETS